MTKHQLHTIVQPSSQAITQKKTSYDFTYAYNASGSNSIRPHAPNHIGDRTYSYDLNGNQTGWTQDTNGTRRTILWNEENRAESITDNGQEKDYKYDDQGTRTIKRGPQGETVYVNQFFTQRPGATGTKHVYAGTSRIVSKLVKQDSVGANGNGNTPFEKDLFFYHPDHLGSSNYITDTNGKLYEHLQYFPFGETWVHENSNTQRTPYLFTAKELDEETGLYYYGARYYDPRTSVWQSADPAFSNFLPGSKRESGPLPGLGGVYNPVNLAVYGYAAQNPLIYVDPSGKDIFLYFWSTSNTETRVGHAAVGVGTLKNQSFYTAAPASHSPVGPMAEPHSAVGSMAQVLQKSGEASPPDLILRLKTSAEQDKVAKENAESFFSERAGSTYRVVGHNCTNLCVLTMKDAKQYNPGDPAVWTPFTLAQGILEKNKEAIKKGDLEVLQGDLGQFAAGTGSVMGLTSKVGEDVGRKAEDVVRSIKGIFTPKD